MDAMRTIPSLFLDFMQMREFAKDPLVFVGGEGIPLTDTAGRRFIDGLSGVFVASLGHGNMPVIEAMTARPASWRSRLPFTAPTCRRSR